jgi:hypothetical protein
MKRLEQRLGQAGTISEKPYPKKASHVRVRFPVKKGGQTGPNCLDPPLEPVSLGDTKTTQVPSVSNRTPYVNTFQKGHCLPVRLARVAERSGYLETCFNEQDVSDPQVGQPVGHPQVRPAPHLHHSLGGANAASLEGETGEGSVNPRLLTQDALEQDGLSGGMMHEVIRWKRGIYTQAGSVGGQQEQTQQEGDDLHEGSFRS